MVSSAEDLINQGIDALIISPFKPDALGPIVDSAKAQGIPVVINDIGGGGTDYDVIVISDNFNGGVLAAEKMDELIQASGSSKQVASSRTWLRSCGVTLGKQPSGRGLQGDGRHPERQSRCGRGFLLQRPDGSWGSPGNRRCRNERF